MEIKDCPKGATTKEEIQDKFDADDTCMNCPNIKYCTGMITCKYGEEETK